MQKSVRGRILKRISVIHSDLLYRSLNIILLAIFRVVSFYKSQELEAVYHNNNFGATITYLVDPQRF